MTHSPLPDLLVEPLVRAALIEDLGPSGDVTSAAVIPQGLRYSARLNARQDGVISGMQLAQIALRLVDPSLVVTVHRADGSAVVAGETVMTIEGAATSILAGERVALNFAGRLSGIATLTAAFVARTAGTSARITCTRKTTPGLRLVEKQAVLHGGGAAHRFGLSDALLIKDNHIAAAGGIVPALRAARTSASHMRRIEIEVDTLAQLEDVLATGGADVVLLDNMTTADLTAAVQRVAGQVVTEASGTMRLERIAEVAATGVDFISVGALTHSAPVLDLGLDF
ncbi:nicotinate-nucleotide pyrophosphorylase [carboxylating] [Roseinatronobacter thiooxidans]|uniref:Probable nicotinate-nucleotide pyrophosphorylase [carboxylating] n=1 Tax=Roseinatronobacter thiooxidans TaxID=121821 RepID=A0A2W7Q390_9RHOB|nr:carboxylating nicotinate-nucleotide diphosphorylase [Roseinatronobacter thiooxidans]PZX42156.1 nicotinate-nucleotide pyrophosphorylase [carboxylating] [Roseinatronobacter thiooxidans]